MPMPIHFCLLRFAALAYATVFGGGVGGASGDVSGISGVDGVGGVGGFGGVGGVGVVGVGRISVGVGGSSVSGAPSSGTRLCEMAF
jgi:hypothetical protein